MFAEFRGEGAGSPPLNTPLEEICIRVVHGLGQPTGWVGLGWVEIF